MATVLIFNGSPRKNGAVSQVLSEIKRGLEESGNTVIEYYLNGLHYRGCQGCLSCKQTETCCLQDDLRPMYEELRDADGIIFGTPIYMFGISGHTKMRMDRLYPMVDLAHHPLYGSKKLISVYSQTHPESNAYEGEQVRVRNALELTGLHEIAHINVTGIDPADRPVTICDEILETAYAFGRNFNQYVLEGEK